MMKPVKIVDARGLKCPEPIMLLHREVRQLGPGEALQLEATDPSTKRDVDKFCRFLNYILIDEKEMNNQLSFLIQRPDNP